MVYADNKNENNFESKRARPGAGSSNRALSSFKIELQGTDHRLPHICVLQLRQRLASSASGIQRAAHIRLKSKASISLARDGVIAECQVSLSEGRILSKFELSAKVDAWMSVVALDAGVASGNSHSNLIPITVAEMANLVTIDPKYVHYSPYLANTPSDSVLNYQP
jgi:hypothetical protein